MRHIKPLGHGAHIAFVAFLGLAATLSIDVRFAHPQTDEAKALYEQSAKLFYQGRYSEAITLASVYSLSVRSLSDPITPMLQQC